MSYLVLDQGSKGEVVKEVGEGLPDISVAVLSEALVIESVDLSNLTRFMVSTQDGDTVLVAELEGDQEGDSLDRVVTTIDIVSHEEVVGIGGVASNPEEFHQIVELTVDVTTNSNGTAHRLDVGLLHKDLASLIMNFQ